MSRPLIISLVLVILAVIGYFLLMPGRHELPALQAAAEKAAATASSSSASSQEAGEGPAGAGSSPDASQAAGSDAPSAADAASETGTASTETAEIAGSDDAGNGTTAAATGSDDMTDSEIADAEMAREEAEVASGPGVGAIASALAIGGIAYGPDGGVTISGKAPEGSAIRVLASGREVGETTAGSDGAWSFSPSLDALAPGRYTLKVEQLGEDGNVVAHASTPFQRAEPEAVANLAESGEFIVQPGDSLWSISQRLFNDGSKFERIFEANRDRIDNPDLIYPGQVLKLPPETE